DVALQWRNPSHQIQSQIDRDLLVARASGVQAASDVAQPLHNQPLDEAVNVFVGSVDEARIGPSPFENFGERLLDLTGLIPRENAGRCKRARPGDAPRHIVFKEAPIELKGRAELE